MLNVFCKTPLWQATRTLAAVAQGKEAADLVIRNVLPDQCMYGRD